MANNQTINLNITNIKELSKPKAPNTTRPESNVDALANVAANTMAYGIQNYLTTSAQMYDQAVSTQAKEATSGDDFIKRVDTNVTPEYKFELLTNQRVAQSQKMLPGIARDIDRNNRDIYASQVLAQAAELRDNKASYGEWEAEAQLLVDSISTQHGSLPQGFSLAFDDVKRKAAESFKRDEIGKNLSQYIGKTTREFLLGKKSITADEAVELLNDKLIPKIQSVGVEWKNLIAEQVAPVILNNIAEYTEANKFVESISDFLSPVQKTKLDNIALNSEIRNAQNTRAFKIENYNMVKKYHDVGLSAPAEMPILNTSQLGDDKNYFQINDFAHMSPEIIAKTLADRPDLANNIITNLKSDFEKDPVEALRARNPFQDIPPMLMPTINKGDIKDENGNIVAYKGDMSNVDEHLNTVGERGLLMKAAQLTYGQGIINGRFSADERQKISEFRNQLNFTQRSEYDAKLIKTLGMSGIADVYSEFENVTGDSDASSVYRQLANPPRIAGGAAVIVKNYQVASALKAEKPEEYARLKAIADKKLSYPVSNNTNTRILPGAINKDINTFLTTNTIGSLYGQDEQTTQDYMDNNVFYWSKGYGSRYEKPREYLDYTSFDFFQGSTEFFDYMKGYHKPTVERVGAAFASKQDYNMFQKQVSGGAVAPKYGEMVPSANFSYSTIRDELSEQYAGTEVEQRLGKGYAEFRSIKDILSSNKSLTITNHNGSLKEFVVVRMRTDGSMAPEVDDNGNVMTFKIP